MQLWNFLPFFRLVSGKKLMKNVVWLIFFAGNEFSWIHWRQMNREIVSETTYLLWLAHATMAWHGNSWFSAAKKAFCDRGKWSILEEETSRTEFGQQMRSLANCPRTCLWIVFKMAYFLIPVAVLFDFGPFIRNSTRVWPTDGPTDGPTDEPTDGPTDEHTLL